MPELTTLILIALVFLFAGTVKGIIGLGLPTISLGLLTVVLDLPAAMVLLLIPSLLTNLWQALAGGHVRVIVRRLWPFLCMAGITVWLGALALTRVDVDLLTGLLGGLLVVYSVLNLAGLRMTISNRREAWAGALLGTANGILTGMTGSFVVPGVMYLQAIGLPRDMLVQSMGMLFSISTLALGLALQGNGLLNLQFGLVSAAAVIPAAAGMLAGQRIRRQLSEERFRRIFFLAIFLLGAWIIVHSVAGR